LTTDDRNSCTGSRVQNPCNLHRWYISGPTGCSSATSCHTVSHIAQAAARLAAPSTQVNVPDEVTLQRPIHPEKTSEDICLHHLERAGVSIKTFAHESKWMVTLSYRNMWVKDKPTSWADRWTAVSARSSQPSSSSSSPWRCIHKKLHWIIPHPRQDWQPWVWHTQCNRKVTGRKCVGVDETKWRNIQWGFMIECTLKNGPSVWSGYLLRAYHGSIYTLCLSNTPVAPPRVINGKLIGWIKKDLVPAILEHFIQLQDCIKFTRIQERGWI
jgi:hypothetical protein